MPEVSTWEDLEEKEEEITKVKCEETGLHRATFDEEQTKAKKQNSAKKKKKVRFSE